MPSQLRCPQRWHSSFEHMPPSPTLFQVFEVGTLLPPRRPPPAIGPLLNNNSTANPPRTAGDAPMPERTFNQRRFIQGMNSHRRNPRPAKSGMLLTAVATCADTTGASRGAGGPVGGSQGVRPTPVRQVAASGSSQQQSLATPSTARHASLTNSQVSHSQDTAIARRREEGRGVMEGGNGQVSA